MEKEKLGDSIFFSEKQLKRVRTDLCELCRKNVTRKQQGIKCDTEECSRWFHYGCVELNDAIVPEGNWYCPYCSNEGILKENVDENLVKWPPLVSPFGDYSFSDGSENILLFQKIGKVK